MRLAYIIRLLLALLIAAVVTGCAAKPVSLMQGLARFDARQYDEAMLVFQEIADDGGENASRARFYMGECYKYQSEYHSAIEQFETVVDAEPPGSYLAAQAREKISQIQKGREDIERLDVLYKDNPGTEIAADALMEKGSVYENIMGDCDGAIRTYRQVVAEFPGMEKAAQAQINIGKIYFYRLYDYEGGWPEYRKVNAENYPEFPRRVEEAENLLRETNKLLQEIVKHQEFIKRAQEQERLAWENYAGIQLPPRVRMIKWQIAESRSAIIRRWRLLKNYPRVLETYRMTIEKQPLMLHQVAEARYSIAEIYQEWGRYVEAIDAYSEYVKLHPTHFMRHQGIYNMAVCYEAMKDYEKAYEMYKTYRDTYPEGIYFNASERKVLQYE